MTKIYAVLVLFALVCIATGSPAGSKSKALALWQQRDAEIFTNTKQLIVELIKNLQKAGDQALLALETFAAGIEAQFNLFLDKLAKDLMKLKDQVYQTIENIRKQIINAAHNIYDQCIEPHEVEIFELLHDIENKTMDCANRHVDHINELIEDAKMSTTNALEYADEVVVLMRNCTEGSTIFETGTCLGALALNTEIKSAIFIAKSAFLISRINIAIATLPASLEVCAGARLVEAGIGTAKILLDTGICAFSPIAPTISLQEPTTIISSIPSSGENQNSLI